MPRSHRLSMTVTLLFSFSSAWAHSSEQAADAPTSATTGQALVEANCNACHSSGYVARSAGFTREGWQSLIATMITLPHPQLEQISTYLAEHYPPQPERRPTLIDGDTSIAFREWTVPTLGQRPRDPLQTADGTIWWAGMWGNLIGRLDPATGEMKEYPLPTGAKPHGLAADGAGNIWYTGNGNATVGRLNTRTGEITEFPMPDKDARDPHTPIVAHDGRLWFTLQHSNRLGVLDPETDAIQLLQMPTERARPYGVREAADGMIWIAYNGSNKLARVHPQTLEVSEFATPTAQTRIRRLVPAEDGSVWYVDSARGYLGRLDPATGEVETWPSPSGANSHPYALEVVGGAVWYNESGQRPDALVRFDPRTEQFQSWAIPSGVGIIRHMRATPAGNLVIHQSSSNRVGLVYISTEAP